MSEDDYEAIMETLYLQQNPANAKRLASAIENLERGKGKIVTINESSNDIV